MNAQTVVVNELGQTTQLGERQFNYDPTGHLRTLTANEGTTEYRYFPNQLRSQKLQGDQITYYDYDLQGQLISERVSHGGAAPVTTREYLWLGHELVGYYTDGQLCFVHNDHLTTPQALSDSQQNKVWSLEKKAFGESTFTDQPITFNIRFPGQYYDQESGLHYNWHRYYDPQLGRYLQSDPIGLNGGLSTFGYVYQNPMSFVDPDGLMARPPPVTPRPPVSAQRPPVPKQRRGESLQEYSKRLQDYARNRNENSRPELKEKPHDATRNGKYDPNSTGPGRKQRFMDKVKDFFESFPSDGFSAPPVAPGDGCNASAIDDCLKSGWCA